MLSVLTLYRNYILVFIILVTDVNPLSLQQIEGLENILSRGNKPIVFVWKKRASEFHHQDSNVDDLSTDNDGGTQEDDNEASEKSSISNIITNFLRTDDSDKLDSSIEETKELLRSAIKSRCNKVDSCVKECPPKKSKCPKNCKEAFDNLDLCPPPKKAPEPKKDKCKKAKTGKTMPPSWL